MGKNPAWSWFIVWYFFLGGMAAGAYFLAALADLFGRAERAARVARAGYAVALPLVAVCPILLTLDLGMPSRTFKMFGIFRLGSPMSVGSWALLGFGLFALASLALSVAEGRAVGTRAIDLRRLRRVLAVPGLLLGFFVASYTGVLLGATNRPLWVGNAWIGPLFVASAASLGAAAIGLVVARSLAEVRRLDRMAIGIEAVVLVLFLWSLGPASAIFLSGALAPLFWGAVVVAGLALPLALQGLARWGRGMEVATAVLVLIGGFALRYVILTSGQV
jgi:formate-dependent nitrite reductase membrane component NrfD